METTTHSPDAIAGFKAEKQTDLQFDFDLEDIIAGNTPSEDIGQQIKAIVDNSQDLPTQGKIEAAIIPLYEAMTADFYREEGGTAEPPAANRQSVKQHAVKVIQARKVQRTASLRAAKRRGSPQISASAITRFQLIAIATLVALLAAVVYFKS